MKSKILIKKNTYRDSVFLMRIRKTILSDVEEVALLVGTEANKKFLLKTGLISSIDDVRNATANDIIIVVKGISDKMVRNALKHCSKMLDQKIISPETEKFTRTLNSALNMLSGANLAFLSIPGSFVKREGLKALRNNLNLFIFSSNVPIEDELELKKRGKDKNLLVMGADCGTAIINGAGLGFANKVRSGPIGVVGASGTGIQEVTTQIHHLGLGISHAIGTGSNDICDRIGGITMIEGLKRLEQDQKTKIIILVSKPPEPIAEKKILDMVEKCSKSVVINFLGEKKTKVENAGALHAETLEMAAMKAVKLYKKTPAVLSSKGKDEILNIANSEATRLAERQKFIRGIFSGGTFAIESSLLIYQQFGRIYSNTTFQRALRLNNTNRSKGHTCVDLGAGEYTLGKPHPMIEPMMREERILKEAKCPDTAVLLLDCVLGFGVHRNPAGVLSSQIKRAKMIAEKNKRYLPVVVSVCGTDEDPQNRKSQIKKLTEVGVIVMPSNVQATELAISIVQS